ncbi:MAG: hypothetical protein Q9M50_14190 [Methylococcales bacterium]|nr:hypothetical protein [Methylococcales bacterium]
MAVKTKKETEGEAQVLKPLAIRTTGAIRFCRAGRKFGKEPVLVTRYTPEQLAAWQAEPILIVK